MDKSTNLIKLSHSITTEEPLEAKQWGLIFLFFFIFCMECYLLPVDIWLYQVLFVVGLNHPLTAPNSQRWHQHVSD